jgi:hypothetical protein
MYNWEYNIDSMQFQHTSFKNEVPMAAATSTISITLPDGIYSYDDIVNPAQIRQIWAVGWIALIQIQVISGISRSDKQLFSIVLKWIIYRLYTLGRFGGGWFEEPRKKISCRAHNINRSIQTMLVNAGAYLIDPTGNNVFYLKLSENSVYYACQVDFSPTPTTLPTLGGTWTRPATGLYSAGGTGLPTTTRVPRLNTDNFEFGKVVGLTAGTYPAPSAIAASAQLSNIIPQIHPTSSYIVRCDLIKNEYVASGDIVSAFDRGDAAIGQLISFKPSQYAWINCQNGSRYTITISIYNQNDKKVIFRDTSVSIMLLLRPKK